MTMTHPAPMTDRKPDASRAGSNAEPAGSDEGGRPSDRVATAGAVDGSPTRMARLRRFWPLGLIVVVLMVFYATGMNSFITLDTIIRDRQALADAVSQNFLAAALCFTATYVLAVAISFPGASLLTILGGFLFGVATGSLLTTVGATLGASVIFVVARTSVGGALRERAGAFAQRFAEGFEANAFSYLLSLRLVPIFPFWLINVVPALFRVPLGTYMGATALGIIPGVVAYTLLGAGLNELIAAQEAANPGCAVAGTCAIDFKALITPQMIAAMVALSAAALIPVAVKHLKRKRTRT